MSRPLRALVVLLTAWVAGRALFLLPDGQPEQVVDIADRPAATFTKPAPDRFTYAAAKSPVAVRALSRPRHDSATRHMLPRLVRHAQRSQARLDDFGITTPSHPFQGPPRARGPAVADAASITSTPYSLRRKRITGSVFVLGRNGEGSSSLGTEGQLGGSQLGVRTYYALGHGAALTARFSTPLAQAGREASIGFAFQRGAMRVLVERRIAIDRAGRNDFSATVTGGFSEIALPAKLRLDGYAQAGVVGSDAFADGAVRAERALLTVGGARVSAGAGIWGGAQPGAARLDIGPQIVARVPVAGQSWRVSTEWRERVAGNARPASGPAITLGVDF